MSPEAPRRPFVPPPIPRPTQLVVCLPDELSIALFIQLGRVIRRIDRSMPDVEHDTQVAFVPHGEDSPGPGLPRLYLFERRSLEEDPALKRLAERLESRRMTDPATVTTTKAGFFNYLHPGLIREQLGVDIDVTDRTDVPLRVAEAQFARERGTGWAWLSPDEQQRRLAEAKRLLVARVAPAMTPEHLTERKGKADVTRWLYAIKLNLPRQFYD